MARANTENYPDSCDERPQLRLHRSDHPVPAASRSSARTYRQRHDPQPDAGRLLPVGQPPRVLPQQPRPRRAQHPAEGQPPATSETQLQVRCPATRCTRWPATPRPPSPTYYANDPRFDDARYGWFITSTSSLRNTVTLTDSLAAHPLPDRHPRRRDQHRQRHQQPRRHVLADSRPDAQPVGWPGTPPTTAAPSCAAASPSTSTPTSSPSPATPWAARSASAASGTTPPGTTPRAASTRAAAGSTTSARPAVPPASTRSGNDCRHKLQLPKT